MLFKRHIPQWLDSPKRHRSHPNANGPLSGHYQPCCSHQEHFDQQVHHQCSDQRCDTLPSRGATGLGLFQGLPRAMWTVTGLIFVFLLMLSAHLQQGSGVLALSCSPCHPELCPEAEGCPGGVVLDICHCCDVCAKMENESCGGSWGFLGKCDRNLQCFIQPQKGQPITGGEAGICKVNLEMSCNDKDCPPAYRHRLCPPDSYLQTIKANNDSIDASDGSSSPETTHSTLVHHGHHRSVELVGNTSFCVCNTSICHVPSCAAGFFLHLRHNATGVPGDCCDDYACRRGRRCDPFICPPIDETPCPPDSVRLPNRQTPDGCCEIQQECTCPAADLCPNMQCPAGSQLQILERATGSPGSCCDRFRCVNETGFTCTYDGQEKRNGERWKLGRCRTCVCQNGINRCKDKHCPDFSCTWMDTPPGECCPVCRGCVSDSGILYNNSAVWKENECTTCSCVNGHAQCQAEMCAAHCSNPKRIPGQCCPVCQDTDQEPARPQCPSLESCPLSCGQGLEVAADGCPRCQCRKEKCSLKCPFGYQSDVEGNPRCECRPRRERCPSLADQECNKKCEYGFKTSPEGCVKCKCNRCPPFRCTKRCVYGIMLNDEGCPLCKCKDISAPDRPSIKKEPEESEGRSCMSQAGVYHDNGESWDDRCRVCYCHNGKEMCSVIACPAPQCPNPVFRSGDCCPSCPGVIISSPKGEKQLCKTHTGQLYVEGETWKMDSCTLCVCHGGSILCETPSCPPALCHRPIKHENQCCAVCKGNDLRLPRPSKLRSKCRSSTGMVYRHGDIWRSTPCQSCVCQDGQFHCYNQMCPVLKCAKTILRKNQCCPTCLKTAEPEVCSYEGETYNSGESWRAEDNCTECTCSSGDVSCHPPSCPSLECSVLIRRKGQCCPVCYHHTKFHSDDKPSTGSKNTTVRQETDENHLGYTIGFSVSLSFFIVIVVILLIVVLYLLRKYKQYPFHERGDSVLEEHQGKVPFLPPKIDLSGDRVNKSERVSNDYTQMIFSDHGKETTYGPLRVT